MVGKVKPKVIVLGIVAFILLWTIYKFSAAVVTIVMNPLGVLLSILILSVIVWILYKLIKK
jgi:hypothetical protein